MVADARAANDPWIDCALDWEQTLRYREYLWDLGLGVAEAMDTAQRGMGLDWPTSLELIRRSVAAAKAWEAREGRPALIFSGCGTDHLDPAAVRSIDEVIRAYEEQMAAIEKAGGRLIVMASRALARVAKSPADYERVYDRVLSQAKEPVIIHWLGEMFDPALAGYWGAADHMQAMETAIGIINAHAAKVDGVKILAARQGQGDRHAPPAGEGRAHVHRRRLQLRRADRRRRGGPQRCAARHLRCHRAGGLGGTRGAGGGRPAALRGRSWRPRCRCRATSSGRRPGSTRRAWCSWPGSTACRTISSWSAASRAPARFLHLAELFRLADRAGLLRDPPLACRRMGHVLALHGID